MKLKTLKDIDEERKGYLWSQGRIIKEIKALAIKWVKEIELSTGGEKYVDDTYCCKPNLINWITKFFNITENDLTLKGREND